MNDENLHIHYHFFICSKSYFWSGNYEREMPFHKVIIIIPGSKNLVQVTVEPAELPYTSDRWHWEK
jgi:hypothetical protein